MKRLLSVVLALMLLVGMVAMVAGAEEEGYTAKLFFATSDWSYQEDGTNAQCQVNGAGSYTISLDVPEGTSVLDAGVFVIDIGEETTENSAADAYKDLVLSSLTVKLDGKEIPVDMAKVPTGNIEEKGRYRIELYNQYGSTKDAAPLDPAAVTGFANMTIEFTLAEAASYTAKLFFATSDWSYQEDGTNAQCQVTGAGSYTISFDVPEGTSVLDAGVFVIDIGEETTENSAADAYKDLTVSALTLKLDGKEIPVDVSKVLCGNLEEKGRYRIELYNQYGATKDEAAAPLDPAAVTGFANMTVEFTLSSGTPVVPDPPEKPEAPDFDPDGTYHAYLGLQTPAWTYRDAWNSDNGIDSDVWGDFLVNNDRPGEKYGKIVDTEIKGNGTYTVSVTEFGSVFADDFTSAGQEWFNLLYISTDLPCCDQLKITDVKIIMDGKTIQTWSEAVLDGDSADYMKVLIQNIWNDDMKEINYYAAPTKSVEMTFTVSGFNYDKDGGEAPAPTKPVEEEKPAGDNNLPIILGVVAAVVVVAVVVVVVLNKKKKQ